MDTWKRHAGTTVLVLCVIVATGALAEPAQLSGRITASPAGDEAPDLWRYELVVTWDNGCPVALSHLDLIVDDGTNCTGEELLDAMAWESPAGRSQNPSGGPFVYYNAFLEMYGDPSLDIFLPMVKFEPHPFGVTEPGPTGEGVFVFWSEFPPWPIDTPNQLLTEKFGRLHCTGQVSGVFPALECAPIPTEMNSWGSVKAGYLE